MKDYQERVVKEKQELDEKIYSLAQFLTTPTFVNLHKDERTRLIAQYGTMRAYSYILGERINNFDA